MAFFGKRNKTRKISSIRLFVQIGLVFLIFAGIFIYHNTFESNLIQLNGCECKDYNTTEPPHDWDNNGEGNFWSDYNGTDANHDGIGDTPYTIDVLNQDRYPLMQSTAQPPFAAQQFPTELIIFVAAFVVVAVVVYVAVRRIKRKA